MIIKDLGITDYLETWQKMQDFTKNRQQNTEDELWITQHNSVYTQGLSIKNNPKEIHNIPVVNTDRGGKITYHGLGQVIIYCLFDLKKTSYGIKKLVYLLEQSVIDVLKIYNINANRKENAPGVYVKDKKISALGLKVKNAKTYHGLSLNVDMNLTPFSFINPCGYQGLKVTQIKDLTNETIYLNTISKQLCKILTSNI